MSISLSRNQMIGIGVGSAILIGIILAFILRSKTQSFEEEETCKRLNGNDIVYFKLDGSDVTFTMRKINYMQLESFIDQINQDLEENRLLQVGGFVNQYYDKPRFRANIRAIKSRYNRVSTLCKDEKAVLETNPNAKIAPPNATTFLNLLDKYLNTILFPYITKVKLDDNDSANDIFTEPIPDSFKQYYEQNTSNTYQSNYLTAAITNPEAEKPAEKHEEKPAKKEEEKPTEKPAEKHEEKPAEKEDKSGKEKSSKNGKNGKRHREKNGMNITTIILASLVLLLAVLYLKK